MVKMVQLKQFVISLFKPEFVYAGDKSFGELVSEKLPSYGDEWSGINVADGQDGIYNTEKAKEKFES